MKNCFVLISNSFIPSVFSYSELEKSNEKGVFLFSTDDTQEMIKKINTTTEILTI